MSIRLRIICFLLVVIGSVSVMAITVYAAILSTEYYLERVKWANHQLEAVTALTVNANRYSEQIAEILLIGEAERPDYDSARAELEAGFDKLEKLTLGEADFLGRSRAQEIEGDEIYRITRMRALYGEIVDAARRAIDLRNQGRPADAIVVFRRDIENRFDAEFGSLLELAHRDEAEEVARAELRAENLWRRQTWLIAATALATIGVCLVATILLVRSLMRPIDLLTVGTEAISRGEFKHRIAYDSTDELGGLVRHFNEMAAKREEQSALILSAHASLEQQVAARTKELADVNLQLTELDRLRVQFLADISHELRTPLTALRGEAEIPLRHGSKPEAVYRDALERIVTQCVEMSRLVDDLVFLSRSETDTIRFEPRRTDLMTVVADAVHEGETLARGNAISIKAEHETGPVWIMADAQRLKQALLIVMDNAIKYSLRGRSVIVSTAVTNGYAEMTIRDQGMGIPAEDLPKVFERFYRGRSVSGSHRPGGGLGLAIAKWLVEKHEGKIGIISEAGSFTEVRILLPLAEKALHVPNSADAGAEPYTTLAMGAAKNRRLARETRRD